MPELRWPHLPLPRKTTDLVEVQIKGWSLKHGPEGRGEPSSVAWPVVTISRQFGAQGVAIGRSVAASLGFSCWDREIVTELARLLHTDEATVAIFDERTHSALDEMLSTFVFQQTIVSSDCVSTVRRVVESIARRGTAVIIGRGAQFFVDPLRALRVRLVAPFHLRVQAVEVRDHLSLRAARRSIVSGDRERTAYIRHATGQDVTSATNYDLVINTGTYPGERAAAVIVMAYLSKFGALPWSTPRKGIAEDSLACKPGTERTDPCCEASRISNSML